MYIKTKYQTGVRYTENIKTPHVNKIPIQNVDTFKSDKPSAKEVTHATEYPMNIIAMQLDVSKCIFDLIYYPLLYCRQNLGRFEDYETCQFHKIA